MSRDHKGLIVRIQDPVPIGTWIDVDLIGEIRVDVVDPAIARPLCKGMRLIDLLEKVK